MQFTFKVHSGEQRPRILVRDLVNYSAAMEEAGRLFCRLIEERTAAMFAGNDIRVEISDGESLLLSQIHAFASVTPAGRALR
jgi:hypothetical protein